MFVFNPKLPRYGSGLGVLAAMRLEAIQKENESRKERGQNCHKKEGAREVPLQQRAWHGKEKQLKEYEMDIQGRKDFENPTARRIGIGKGEEVR